MKRIGSKSTSKAKYKGTAYKCDLCGRKFMSIDALKSHQRSVHNLQPDKSRLKQYGKQAKKPEVKEKIVKKASVMESTVTPNRSTRTRSEKVPIQPQTGQSNPTNTVEFECPKCFKSFDTYFIASRHIQKFHCVDKKGGKVSPHSSSIIQPQRKELCLKCKRKVKSIPSHICGVANKMVEEEGLNYNCTGCDTTFNNKRSFYSHVVTSHPDGVESLFFPKSTDFTKWKEEMETQTNTDYSEVDKFDSKCYYHCGYKSGNIAKACINICPSIIVIQEYTKGIQVHYYKKHYRHGTKDYNLLYKYKKFSITSFLKSSDSYFDLTDLKNDDNDMYIQFKRLMESIVLDAAKLKTDSLTVLFGKALEMTSILTGYDEEMSDDGSKPLKRNMTDTQIAKALEESPIKEKMDNSEPCKKKPKNNIDETEAPSPMIVNSFSLADKSVQDVHGKPEPTEPSIKVKDLSTLQNPTQTKDNSQTVDITKDSNIDQSKIDTTPSSFNESYAEFLEKNFPAQTETLGKRRSDRRNIVKTKIGQYKPPSPKRVIINIPPDLKKKAIDTSAQEPKTKVNNTSILQAKLKQSPGIEDQAKRSPQSKQQLNSPVIEAPKRKSVRVPIQNTKFKNEISPIQEIKRKSITPVTPTQDTKEIKSRPQIKEKPKVEIKYEVKEREDDCNILILKI